ncbi:hypothetical protein CSA56_18035 [candidate division KSB3 bacterium]|uniref:Uncharacterized protein n=1 Tax=candidate division KSB3 bacterium TaxID=2044937 RepID=A0A2G6K972_9BACT|nr:MAG: hypothetical protein CSA56_18035 [candidate division KSB3 bacterium]
MTCDQAIVDDDFIEYHHLDPDTRDKYFACDPTPSGSHQTIDCTNHGGGHYAVDLLGVTHYAWERQVDRYTTTYRPIEDLDVQLDGGELPDRLGLIELTGKEQPQIN